MRRRGIPYKQGRCLTPEEITRGQQASVVARRARTKEVYADLVPLVAEMRERGLSIYEVADDLNARGQRNQRGLTWQPSAVASFLRREGLPPLPEALRVRGPVSERIRAKSVIAARESLRRRMEEADVEASPIALRLLGEGRSRVGIARDLNDRGLRVRTGAPWRAITVLALLRRAGALPPGPARRYGFTAADQDAGQRAAALVNPQKALEAATEVEPLARRLLLSGYTYREVADVLNSYAYKPNYADRWTKSILYLAIRRLDDDARESVASPFRRRRPDT